MTKKYKMKTQILAIGRDPVLLQSLLRFINQHPKWEGTGTIDDETAIEIFQQRPFEIVVLINEIEWGSRKKFESVFTFYDPQIIFVDHEGNEPGLLVFEIQEALDNRNYLRNNIIDDIF